ncbi:helix-turn-helix domain-containing protein [Saccharothrix sp. AJ9571]|nr:helix-turn-helix domain-containing protein [Saccharothrix sp. AJ9571]
MEQEEAQRLVKITRSTRDRVRLRRSGIVLASVQGRSAREIAVMFAATEGYVREVIHAFNESGFAALSPKWSGGRPGKFGPAARDQICRIAACTPTELGLPFTTWSLTKLVDYLAEHARIRASTETVRQILRKEGVSWQPTKTWKASKDPDFVAKKTRILDLYDHPPADGRVNCVDEPPEWSAASRPSISAAQWSHTCDNRRPAEKPARQVYSRNYSTLTRTLVMFELDDARPQWLRCTAPGAELDRSYGRKESDMSGYIPKEVTDPEIIATFRRESGGFVSRSAGGFISCPPYVIASVAADRVRGGALKLPDGYDNDTLDQIKSISGFVERDTRISLRQAAELAHIGTQILELNSEGKVQPTLNHFEKQSIVHLLAIVSVHA